MFATYEIGRDLQKRIIYCDQECRETAVLEEVLVSEGKSESTHQRYVQVSSYKDIHHSMSVEIVYHEICPPLNKLLYVYTVGKMCPNSVLEQVLNLNFRITWTPSPETLICQVWCGGLWVCTSSASGDIDIAGPGTLFWKPLFKRNI